MNLRFTQRIHDAITKMREMDELFHFTMDCAEQSNIDWVANCNAYIHFAWLPKRCTESNRIIWLKQYYHVFKKRRIGNIEHVKFRIFSAPEYIRLRLLS